MDEKEKKVRKQWLSLLFVGLAISSVSYYFPFKQFSSQIQMDSFVLVMIPIIVVPLLTQLAFTYILYHCAYKKPGTKLLLFSLILTGVGVVINPFLYFFGWINVGYHIPYYGAYLTLSELLGICWTVVCWKMRAINLRLKAASSS